MTDLAKLRARLAALRAKTTANGCTEAEAIAAAEKAAELLSTYGVTEAELDAPVYDELIVVLGGRRTPLDTIWPQVAAFANCTGYLSRSMGFWRYVYFGRDGDVVIAEYVHEIIRRAADGAVQRFRGSPEYQRRRIPKTRARALKAYLEGFAAAIVRKLSDGLWKRLNQQAPGRAVTVFRDHEEELRRALEARGVRLKSASPIAAAKGAFREAARMSGSIAGRSVSIEAGLADGSVSPVAGLIR